MSQVRWYNRGAISPEDTLKHALAVLVGFCAALLLTVPQAHAAERYLGTIVVTDGGTVHNLFPLDGGAFFINPNELITIQPNANAYVCVGELTSTKAPTCSATLGVRVDANVAFPSSCPSGTAVLMADGGFVNSCVVACLPVSGATVNCPVWSRKGNEL